VSSLLVQHYKGSVVKALSTLFPEFSNAHKEFFDNIAKDFKIRKPIDWCKVNYDDVHKREGGPLILIRSGRSIFKILSKFYPNYEPEMRKLVGEIGKILNIKKFSDWEQISEEQFISRGGKYLIYHFGSLKKLLLHFYPDHKWKFAERKRISHSAPLQSSFWKDNTNVRNYMDNVAKKLHVQDFQDWYKISTKDLSSVGVYKQLKYKGGLRKILPEYYPEYNWDLKKFEGIHFKASQKRVTILMGELFPNVEIWSDYVHPDLKYPDSNRSMELDIYIPALSLAVEYNGPQHFHNFFYFGTSPKEYQSRDEAKRIACKQAKITLIEVPYWWDLQKESLAATIHEARFDLLISPKGKPIPKFAPTKSVSPIENVHKGRKKKTKRS